MRDQSPEVEPLALARATPSFTQRQDQQARHARNGSGDCGANRDVIGAERAMWDHGIDETASEYSEHRKEARMHDRIIACWGYTRLPVHSQTVAHRRPATDIAG
jgi:hypothetical protein